MDARHIIGGYFIAFHYLHIMIAQLSGLRFLFNSRQGGRRMRDRQNKAYVSAERIGDGHRNGLSCGLVSLPEIGLSPMMVMRLHRKVYPVRAQAIAQGPAF